MPNRGVRSEPERVAILLPSGVMGSAEFSDTTRYARQHPT